MRPALALLVVTILMAGCIAAAPVDDASLAGDAPLAPVPSLDLQGRGCTEGGGHSVHPKTFFEKMGARILPEPWEPADVLDDVGPQLTYSEWPDPERPVPEKGRTMGNYHATIACEAWTWRGEPRDDLVLGFVGMKVERPPWSDDAPTHHYLVTVVATSDEEVHAALTAGGIAAMRATSQWTRLPSGAVRIEMETDHNGAYDSLFVPKPHGPMKATHVRLWFQQENGDGTHTPVALDLLSEGGEHLVAHGEGYFSHSGTEHHAPFPGAHGKTAALLYQGFVRELRWGPRADDVRIEGAYHH